MPTTISYSFNFSENDLDGIRNASTMRQRKDFKQEEILRSLQEGDESAFNSIFMKYRNSLYNNVLNILKDPYASEDVVQEVFVALWEKRRSIDPKKNIGNWVFRVSHNKSINYIRKKHPLRYNLKDFSEIPCSNETIEKVVIENQYQILELAIAQLSPQKYKVLQICKLQSKSYAEAAIELKISRHTVKEYLCGAMKELKQQMYSLS